MIEPAPDGSQLCTKCGSRLSPDDLRCDACGMVTPGEGFKATQPDDHASIPGAEATASQSPDALPIVPDHCQESPRRYSQAARTLMLLFTGVALLALLVALVILVLPAIRPRSSLATNLSFAVPACSCGDLTHAINRWTCVCGQVEDEYTVCVNNYLRIVCGNSAVHVHSRETLGYGLGSCVRVCGTVYRQFQAGIPYYVINLDDTDRETTLESSLCP